MWLKVMDETKQNKKRQNYTQLEHIGGPLCSANILFFFRSINLIDIANSTPSSNVKLQAKSTVWQIIFWSLAIDTKRINSILMKKQTIFFTVYLFFSFLCFL